MFLNNFVVVGQYFQDYRCRFLFKIHLFFFLIFAKNTVYIYDFIKKTQLLLF